MLLGQLDKEVTVLGLDEHTGLIIDLEAQECQVLGKGEIHVIIGGIEKSYLNDSTFQIHNLGNFHPLAERSSGIKPGNWQKALEVSLSSQNSEPEALPPMEVMEALELRRLARLEKNWKRSDQLRAKISDLGWRVVDTSDGQKLERCTP